MAQLSHLLVLSVTTAVLWMTTTVQAQTSCVGLPTQNLTKSLLEADIVAGGGDPGSDFVVRGGPFYTCQAQGTSNGTYRWLSAIFEYTSNTQDRVGQFEMRCASTGEWNRISDSLQILPGTTYDGSIALRTNCSECNNNAGNDAHCVACDDACNEGLMRCTGTGNDDCCKAFEDDGMCTDSECDDTNFVASQQNVFFCSCNLTSCDPGYSIITNSSGCYCVLSNICMTQPSPCNNNGSCTLNSPPDNFTCNCTGTGYTGDTCEVLVTTTTSIVTTTTTSSPVPTTTSSVIIITSTTEFVITLPVPTTTTTTVSTSIYISPSAAPTEEIITDEKTALWVIIVTVIIALLLLILLIILIIYIIYYCLTKKGSDLAKAKPNSPFGNGESHNNPLYLKPDEVTSEVANLYTP